MTKKRSSAPVEPHAWAFRARFRRHAFGWQSQPAIVCIKEAVAEIKKVAKTDPAMAAEGAIVFIERVSPAIEQVDSSSGALGTAVDRALEALVPIIASATADTATREAWLERLFDAFQADGIPYLERLGDHWGTLCASATLASAWADRLIGTVRLAWSSDPQQRGSIKATTSCLSALVAAGRTDDVLALLELAPYKMWHYRQFGMQALLAQGKKAEALRYAEASRDLNDSPVSIARACEAVLLSSGLADEAYRRYGLEANRSSTYLATFRAVAKKYPHKTPSEILADLVQTTPGDEGKWFAAAKDAGLYDDALALARRSPCDPKTLTRAARDLGQDQPAFASEVGLLALRWLTEGYGYEITGADVLDAYQATIDAAERRGTSAEVKARVRQAIASGVASTFVARLIGRQLA